MYVMKGVTFVLVHGMVDGIKKMADNIKNTDFYDGFEDEDEAAYTEAMMEIVKQHRLKIVTKLNGKGNFSFLMFFFNRLMLICVLRLGKLLRMNLSLN